MFKLEIPTKIQIATEHHLRANTEIIQVAALQKIPVYFLIPISELQGRTR